MVFVQKMSLTQLLQKVLENIDRLRAENEEFVAQIATQKEEISQLEDDKAALNAEVQRLLPYELEVLCSPLHSLQMLSCYHVPGIGTVIFREWLLRTWRCPKTAHSVHTQNSLSELCVLYTCYRDRTSIVG